MEKIENIEQDNPSESCSDSLKSYKEAYQQAVKIRKFLNERESELEFVAGWDCAHQTMHGVEWLCFVLSNIPEWKKQEREL